MLSLEEKNEKTLKLITSTEFPTNPGFNDLSGKTFGKLHVESYVGRDAHRNTFYWCICECGNRRIVARSSLVSGKQTSCGCLIAERAKETLAERDYNRKATTSHGLSDHPLYNTYYGMQKRCYNISDKDYPRYGGRGIKICDEWMGENGFEAFYRWAISAGWKHGLTIDRINTNGNYSPENCRWVTIKVQENNRRNTKYYTYGKITLPLGYWSDILGMTINVISHRLSSGWSFDEVVETPVGYKPGEKIRLLVVPEYYMQFNKYNEEETLWQ